MSPAIDTHKISVTIFHDAFAKKKDARQWTLVEMRDEILKTKATTKKKLPWLKLAEFGTKVTEKASLRHDANVSSVVGCELDYDDELVSFEEAIDRLGQLEIRALVYTSPSNTKTKFRWRILAPFSRALPPQRREQIAKGLNAAFGNIFAPESFVLSQSYYYGAAADNGAQDHRAVIIDGRFIDLCDDLEFDEWTPPKPTPPPPPPGGNGKEHSAAKEKRSAFERHLSRMGDGEKSKYDGFNDPLIRATSAYARQHGVDLDRDALKEKLRAAIRDAHKKPERPQGEIDKYLGDKYLDNLIATAIDKYALKGIVVSANDHWDRAKKMRELQRPHLVHYRDDFMDWMEGAYRIVDDLVINADTWSFLNTAVTVRGTGEKRTQAPFQPNRTSVGETLAALKAVAILDPGAMAPAWIDGREDLPPEDIIAFPNGLLDLRDNKFHPLDPAFFTTASLGFDYVAEAEQPKNWLAFLEQIYEGDDSAAEIAQVQEIFGYLLTGDISQEKAFLFLGPKRSGKGTMIRMLRYMLATSAVAGPTLKSLDTNFGLEPLIDKQLAIIDDLRIGTAREQGSMVENILKITGRGLFTMDRKFKSKWTGMLPVKLVFISNPMPKFADESGALASRIITSNTTQSFYGREDPLLFKNKLLPELLGVFHWALDGLRRLRERGYFKETEGSKETQEQLAHLGSPVMGFIAESCELHPSKSVHKGELFAAWQEYAVATNGPFMTPESFFSALYAAAEGKVRSGRRREGGKQVQHVLGIDLKEGGGGDAIKKILFILHETEKGVCVARGCDDPPLGKDEEPLLGVRYAVWLPLSRITVGQEFPDRRYEIKIPRWLAKSSGVLDWADAAAPEFKDDSNI